MTTIFVDIFVLHSKNYKQGNQIKLQTVIRQKIVKGCSGYALPSQTTYIMGSSGAGKTSLLNILSDRVSSSGGKSVKGSVTVNDTLKLESKVFGNFAAYVMQDDILYEFFTPKEALTFAARLKLKGTEEFQDRRVQEVLSELGLSHVQNVRIGSAIQKTISGGERKRTAIGVELITDPQLILLDEPTSGLDSFKALQIVKLLDKFAQRGKTVVATIHQPSSEAFQTFNRLILMVDGYIVYQGDAKKSVQHFAKLGFNCPLHSNPSDYFMKILSINYPKSSDDEKFIKILTDGYATYLQPDILFGNSQNKFPKLSITESGMASGLQQFKQLLIRNLRGCQRNPLAIHSRVGQGIFMGLLCLALFWKQESLSEARSLISGLFFVAVSMIFGQMMPTILTFQIERPVFLREQANRMYNVVPYYFGKMIVDIPIVAFCSLLFVTLLYFGVGLTVTANQFFIFFAANYLTGEVAASLGYFISSIFEHEETAVELAPIIVMPIILFGGQFSNSGTLQSLDLKILLIFLDDSFFKLQNPGQVGSSMSPQLGTVLRQWSLMNMTRGLTTQP